MHCTELLTPQTQGQPCRDNDFEFDVLYKSLLGQDQSTFNSCVFYCFQIGNSMRDYTYMAIELLFFCDMIGL